MSTLTETRIRKIARVIDAIETADGAGVRLRRSIGRAHDLRLDPFLMLDEFSSDNPYDYVAGFPAHPHRGFETVTYMLDGHMRHEDHLGNRGELVSGAVQWMSAGRGIVHSEMPQQEHGRMRGFQLWINLPAAEKMKAPAYRDIQPADIPVATLDSGARVKVIAGTYRDDTHAVRGPIQGGTTEPLYFDVHLPAGARFTHALEPTLQGFVYLYEGSAEAGPEGSTRTLFTHSAGVLASGDEVQLQAGAEGARFLLLAGRPLREPIVQYGPFVMNTQDEIRQAIADYQSGRFVVT
jgi:redox-sensitive bicupin YhaK (pirin superfamily)